MIDIHGKIPESRNKNGKSQPSTFHVNGVRTPYWVIDNGGFDKTNKKIEDYIILGYDYKCIAFLLNIRVLTCMSYVKKYIAHQKDVLDNISLNVKHHRMSKALKGKPSSLKGRTYKQIHGTDTPRCGFRRGKDNPNFTRPKYIGCVCVDKFGNKCRSKYEVELSELLIEHNIQYDYEHHYTLCNGKVKVVDFTVGNCLIEVTGYAYEQWRNDFDVKIQLLARTYPDKTIYIISKNSGKKESIIDMLKDKHENNQIKVIDLTDHNTIINTLKYEISKY